MTDQWRTLKINETGRLVTGKTPSSSKPECFGDKYPFITPTDMHDCRYASTTARYLSEEGAAGQKTLKVPAGSVAVSCIGWQMGKSIVTTRPSFTNQQLHTILPNDEVDSLYLYYYLCTQRVELLSLGSAAGVRTPIINKSAFGLLSIPVPPLPTQRKIASILSAYDDLIENNTRRIAILEEMAQAIYREWFVNFRFPGHENVKLVDSPLGQIPEGWEVGKLEDVLVLQRGFDLPKTNRVEGGVPIYASTGVTGLHNEAKVKGPGVLTGRSGSLGTVTYIHEDFWPLNTTLWIKKFKWGTPAFAYYVLSGIDFETFNSGAAVPSLNRNNVHGLPTLLPNREVIAVFDEIAIAIFDQAKLLRRKNENLRTTRDLLLPKLISGKLDVEDLDIDSGLTAEALEEATA